MTTDPSWLYSTIAQSSAAIVAIIGGFITSTILARRAEKVSLQKELEERKAELRELDSKPLTDARRMTEEERQKSIEEGRKENVRAEYLKSEILRLKNRLDAFTYPPNLVWGLFILGYLAIVGILLPVLLIANEAFFAPLRQFTAVLFGLGIAGLFTYISFQIVELRRKTK
jgi:hypothetical protein